MSKFSCWKLIIVRSLFKGYEECSKRNARLFPTKEYSLDNQPREDLLSQIGITTKKK